MAEKETPLAAVLGRLLTAPDHWVTFTDSYLGALDEVTARSSSAARGRSATTSRDERTADLAAWHALLLDRLPGHRDYRALAQEIGAPVRDRA